MTNRITDLIRAAREDAADERRDGIPEKAALLEALADELEALTVPDGDARERLADLLEELDGTDFMDVADAILAAFPVLSRAAAPEPEWEHGVIGGDDLLARLMDTLAYYHCRSVNPKADSPHLGYHAMSEDQREFLRERQREAAEDVLRMWQAESEWEYTTRAGNGFLYEVTTLEDAELSVENSRRVHGYPGSSTPHLIRHVVRRRKAGPWVPLPVGGETDGE